MRACRRVNSQCDIQKGNVEVVIVGIVSVDIQSQTALPVEIQGEGNFVLGNGLAGKYFRLPLSGFVRR